MSTHNFCFYFSSFLLLLFIVLYITNRKRNVSLHTRLLQTEQEYQQRLLKAIIESQENERLQISKELHDNIGSSLSHLRHMINLIQSAWNDQPELKKLTEKYKSYIDLIIRDVRNISHNLSPAGLEIWGLHDAIENFCDRIRMAEGLDITIEDDTNGALKNLVFDDALSLFRVIQELITNTIKHASAHKIAINTSLENDYLKIQYYDDGVGTDIDIFNSEGIGIYNIKNRLSIIKASYNYTSSSEGGFFSPSKYPVAV